MDPSKLVYKSRKRILEKKETLASNAIKVVDHHSSTLKLKMSGDRSNLEPFANQNDDDDPSNAHSDNSNMTDLTSDLITSNLTTRSSLHGFDDSNPVGMSNSERSQYLIYQANAT